MAAAAVPCPTCGGSGSMPAGSGKTMTVPNHQKGQVPAGLAAWNAKRKKVKNVDTRTVKQKLVDAQSRTNGGK